jgi:hypothetical protein
MDIRMSQHEKRLIRLGRSLLIKKIGSNAEPENIHEYLMSTKSKALKDVVELINFIADNTKNKHQSDILRIYSEFALFIAINHEDFRKMIEGLLSTFTKYDDVKIDLPIVITKIDKFIIESGLKFVIKKMQTRPTYRKILEESYAPSNKFVNYFLLHADKATIDIKSDYLVSVSKTLSWIALWIAVNDTAYRHQFYYALKKIGNKRVQKIADEFYLEPEKWFINVYNDGVQKTRELWEKGEIPRHRASSIEENCVPERQKEKIERNLKKTGGGAK